MKERRDFFRLLSLSLSRKHSLPDAHDSLLAEKFKSQNKIQRARFIFLDRFTHTHTIRHESKHSTCLFASNYSSGFEIGKFMRSPQMCADLSSVGRLFSHVHKMKRS